MCFNVSICFHAEALSISEQQSHAKGGTFAALSHRRYYNRRITLLTGLVYNLPYVGRGMKLCNEVQGTAPEFPGFWHQLHE